LGVGRKSQKIEDAETSLDEAWLTLPPETRHSFTFVGMPLLVVQGQTLGQTHICYPIKFGRCISNRLGIGRDPKNWGRWDPAPSDGEWTHMLLLHLFYSANFGHSRSNHTTVNMEIPPQNLIHHVPPFRVTQGHWNRHGSIGCL